MSSAIAWVWENLVGLVVEDGQLAIGIVLALVVVGFGSFAEALHPFLGWLLLALLVALLLLNLVLTARRVKRRGASVSPPPQRAASRR